MKKGFISRYVIPSILTVIMTPMAFAHAPLMSCYIDAPSKMLACEGGFSDGSSAAGIEIRVLSYEDKVLDKGLLDKDSQITFHAPDGEYYVVFDGGPGHIVELDHNDIPKD